MTEIRTIRSEIAGPITLDLTITTGTVGVIIEKRSAAEVTLRAPDGTPAAEAVRNATSSTEDGTLSVWVSAPAWPHRYRRDSGSPVSNMINGHVNGPTVQAGDIAGGLSLGKDGIVVQARSVVQDDAGDRQNPGEVEVEVRLPERSSVRIDGPIRIDFQGTLTSVQTR